MANCTSAFSRMIISLLFLVLACGLITPAVSAGSAAEPSGSTAFKDPYNGGIKLPAGGGEPGRAYIAFINAAYRKDYKQICRLLADPADVPKCLEQKEALDANIGLLTLPKSHKVLGGFMKGEEATLNVAYAHKEGPQSTGFVVMKKAGNRWMISSTGGSGSGSFSAEASGTADLSRGPTAGSAGAGQLPEPDYAGPAYGKWTFTGDDDKGDTWTGTLAIEKLGPDSYDAKKYQLHIMLEMRSSKSERRIIDTPCTWEPGKREVSCITELGDYRAVLSTDRKSLTRGTWNAKETEDWKNYKVIKTGGWTAAYTGK